MVRFSIVRFVTAWALLAALPLVAAPAAAEGGTESPAQASRDRQTERVGQSGLPLPRFVSLRAAEVNLRTGPGTRYPIDWVYRRRDLPVEIIDEFDTWRRIRDVEGTVGWVHQSMLQGQRYLLVTGAPERLLHRGPDDDAAAVARLEPGVLGRLKGCDADWCLIDVEDHSGWLRREHAYGVYPDEEFR